MKVVFVSSITGMHNSKIRESDGKRFILCTIGRENEWVERESIISFDEELYASQTKILECRTNLSECIFEALFNDS